MLENLLIISVIALYISLNIITISWLVNYLAYLDHETSPRKPILHNNTIPFAKHKVKITDPLLGKAYKKVRVN